MKMGGNPHILVLPYPAQGHVIPLMELSQSLINHGIRITFVNTENNHNLLINSNQIQNQINLVSIPDGLELEDRNKPGKLSEAVLNFMPRKFENIIEQINGVKGQEITCILADQSLGWAMEISLKKGIPCAAFCPAAAALLVLGFCIPKLIHDGIIDDEGTPIKEQIIKLSPTMPPMNTSNFVWACIGSKAAQKNIFNLMLKNNTSLESTAWLLCNSSFNLEPAAFTMAPHILPIGPLSSTIRDENNRPGSFMVEDSTCLSWLDQQPPCSVIYIAFGSFTIFNTTQLQELALGLELLSRPFLWVIRPDTITATAGLKAFEERVAGRGRMVRWAPQKKVLSHKSVACFMSHCGWNSTMEGISCGVPFLCWPYFADQFVNRSYICDIWKVGLGLESDENGIVTREEIVNKVEGLFGDGGFKEKAFDLMAMVMTSVGEGGESNDNLKKFIQWIKSL